MGKKGDKMGIAKKTKEAKLATQAKKDDSKIEKLGFTDVKVSRLVKADWNYKEEDEKKTSDLIANFKKNGQIENLLIRELKKGKYEVVNGNHRLDVMKILKMDMAHVYNFGECSLEEAQRIAIETNETKFGVDDLKLAKILKELLEKF